VHSKFVDQFASCAVLGAGLLAKRRRGRRLELDAQHTLSASLERISGVHQLADGCFRRYPQGK